jgi:hypothetical protein
MAINRYQGVCMHGCVPVCVCVYVCVCVSACVCWKLRTGFFSSPALGLAPSRKQRRAPQTAGMSPLLLLVPFGYLNKFFIVTNKGRKKCFLLKRTIGLWSSPEASGTRSCKSQKGAFVLKWQAGDSISGRQAGVSQGYLEICVNGMEGWLFGFLQCWGSRMLSKWFMTEAHTQPRDWYFKNIYFCSYYTSLLEQF